MEWQIVTVVMALVGLFFTVAKPIIGLTKTIAKLDNTCERLDFQFGKFEVHNKESHRRLWEHTIKQDKAINAHEMRIVSLEKEGLK